MKEIVKTKTTIDLACDMINIIDAKNTDEVLKISQKYGLKNQTDLVTDLHNLITLSCKQLALRIIKK